MTIRNRGRFHLALDLTFAAWAAWSWLTRPAPTAPEEDHVLPCVRYVTSPEADQAARERAVKVCADAWREVREIERDQAKP
jgi:hypothetical protein